jgi:hypothetical protein
MNRQIKDLEAKVAAQGKQIAALTAELGKLQREPEPKPAPRSERGVSIRHPGPVLPREWPSENELDALNKIVGAHHPRLAYAAGDHAGRRQFANAFLYLSFARRQEAPNTGYALSYWVDAGRQWLRQHGSDTYFTEPALIAAAIVHGIPYTAPPYSSLGLTFGHDSQVRNSAWKEVLSSSRCPDLFRK